MPDFMLAYHGGKMPESPEEGAKAMAAWEAWYKDIGENVVHPGNPVGQSKTVSATGVEDNGGANPASGYGIFDASDEADAIAKAKGCPILEAGGSVELAPIIDM